MKVRAATLADLPTTTDIAIEAFQDDFLYQWMYPQKNQFPADYRAASLLRQKHNLYTPGCCFLVAETEPSDQQWSGHPKISGYAIWDRVGHTAAAAPWQSRSIADSKPQPRRPTA